MDDDVGAESDGLLEVRAEKCVVDDQREIALLCDGRNGGQVGNDHRGVRGRFAVDHARGRPDGFFDLFEARRVDIGELKAEVDEQLRNQAKCSAIERRRQNRVIARPKKTEDCIDRRHAGSEGVSGFSTFEFGQGALKGHAVRVRGARVDVAFVLVQVVEHIGRRLIDRSHDGAGQRIRLLAHVNRVG